MCDIRLFRSAMMDYATAALIWRGPYSDEMILNNAAYHLQQTVYKILIDALECVGVTAGCFPIAAIYPQLLQCINSSRVIDTTIKSFLSPVNKSTLLLLSLPST